MKMLAEGYTVNVQCDFCPEPRDPRRDQFFGKNKHVAYKELRDAGWKTYPAQNKAKCPYCVKRSSR